MKRVWLVWFGFGVDREFALEWFGTKAEANKWRREYVRAHLVDCGTGVARFDRAARSGGETR